MFMRRDFDMNTTQRYADSLRQALKETMLNQELVFRKQVHELHRLYMNQKTLMDDLTMKDFNNYNPWNATAELTPNLHLASPGYNIADLNTLSNNPLVGSTQSIDQPGPIDLRFCTDRSHGDDEFRDKDHALNSSLVLNSYSFCADNVCELGKVNLSLGIGVDTMMKEIGNTRYGEKMSPYAQEVTDLEKSIERVSTEVLQFSALSNSFLSKCEKKEPAEAMTLVDANVSSPERSSFNPGPLVHYESLPCELFLIKTQKVASSIDLNIVQLDDSSINSNDPLIVYPSTASPSIVLHGVVSEGVYGASTCSIKGSPETSEKGNKMQGLTFPFPFPYQTQDMDQAASCSCAMDSNSIRARTDMQSLIQLVDLNSSTSNVGAEISLGSEVTENVQELDALIKMAADSLVCLSLEKSSFYPDSASKAGSKEIKNDKKEKPEYSCDSYESLVLKIPESSVDECCVTSKLSEVDEIVKNGFGSKLKRGRRLKNFQKDILPGMVSLSRQEICEDVNIMTGVIRSREYRKIHAKKDIVVNRATPVRSRRSKRIYIGRNK